MRWKSLVRFHPKFRQVLLDFSIVICCKTSGKKLTEQHRGKSVGSPNSFQCGFCASVWALWHCEICRTVWFSSLPCRGVHPLCFPLPPLSQERVKICVLALHFPLRFPWSLLTFLLREELCHNTRSIWAINTSRTQRCTKRFGETWISQGWRWPLGCHLEEELFIWITGLKCRVLKSVWGFWGKEHLWAALVWIS